ncbi:MAG: efflux RND transporter periplasmic adaptor subunit [Vicingaceae bacterium]
MKDNQPIRFLLIAVIAAALSSCGGGSEIEGNAAQLMVKKDSLRTVKKGIAQQINQIEETLKLMDTSGNANLPVVTVSETKTGIFRHYFKVQGVVETDQNATINAEVASKIMKIHVGEGDRVKKGQLMMALDNRVMLNNIEELKTQIELAQTVYEKQKSLWDQNIGSEIQYLEAKANKESLQQKLNTLNAQMEYYLVKSPFDGIIDEIFPKAGEMAAPGVPLLRVMNLQHIYLKADVSEGYLGKIAVGDTSIIDFSSSKLTLKSSISRIGRYINPNNRTFKIRFEIENKNEKLIPNQLAEVNVLDYVSPKPVVIIPTKLLQETSMGEEFVYVLHENGQPKAKKALVETGRSYHGEVEILSGLSPEDMIIVDGARGIKDGEVIEVATK